VTSNNRDARGAAPFGFTFMAPLALGAALNPINSTMLTTALVPIAESLHASAAETGWLIAVLYLTTAVAQPTMGRLVDLFGPRRIYLLSLFFVAAAGIFGQMASSLAGLMMVRVVLGVGTSGAYPAAMRIFREQADRTGSKPPRVAMGVLSLAAISTTAVGPLMGGVLTSAFGWQSIFTVNVPLALLTALLILLWVPKDQPRKVRFARLVEEVDLIGIGLFTGFLPSLMVFLMNLHRPVWLALAAAPVFGAAFVVHSLRRRQPFIDVRMLARNRPLTVTYLRAGAVMMIVFSVFYGFAQWLESAIGLSSAAAGLVTMPMSVVAAVSSLTGVRTKGLRAPFIISIGAALLGCVCLFLIDSGTSIWIVATAVMAFGVPMGMFSTATQAAVYIQAPAAEIGTAAGLQRTAQYIGAVAATGLLALTYGQHATDHGLHDLAAVMGGLSAVLFIATVFDRTIPRVASVAVAIATVSDVGVTKSGDTTATPNRTENHSELV
jgi:MFS family permease